VLQVCSDSCNSEIDFSVLGLAVQKRRTGLTGEGCHRILFSVQRYAENGAGKTSNCAAYLLWLGKDLLD